MVLVAALLGGDWAPQAAELLMFDDPACIWCQRWNREIGPGYRFSPEGRLAPLRRIDIRQQAAAGVQLASPVRATPTFVLIDRDQEVGRIAGYVGRDFFYPMLSELLRRLRPPRPDLGWRRWSALSGRAGMGAILRGSPQTSRSKTGCPDHRS
jgi:hypothetical protein